MPRPIKIFISYAREDQDDYLVPFRHHLEPLVDHGLIEPFDDRQLALGDQWDPILRAKLAEAELVIFLVSAPFVNSGYIKTVELADAMARAKADAARCWLMPVVVRPVALEYTPLGAFTAYPSRGSEGLKAVSQWTDRDEAYTLMTRAIGAWAKKRGEQGPASGVTAPSPPTPGLGETPRSNTPSQSPTPRLWTPGHVFRHIDAPWCPEMVVIPAGKFNMGSSPDEQAQAVKDGAKEEWVKREGPQHRVRIAKPFALGKYAVTFEEFDEFQVEAGYAHRPEASWGRDRMPVVNVSWEDARAYCQWLSAETKAEYRLPSEAEWEYACRAGTNTRYSWGDQAPDKKLAKVAAMVGRTMEVGSYPANPWGLFDMHSNVWEWCADAWHDSYEGAPKDGSPWHGDEYGPRVVRGGSWNCGPELARCADRNWTSPRRRDSYLGLRLACSSPI